MKGIKSLKLSSKLILLFFIIIIIHAAVSLISLSLIISRTNRASQEIQFTSITHGVARYLSKVVNDLQVKAALFAGQEKIINYTEYGLYNLLERQLAVYWQSLNIDFVAIFSEKLQPVASIGESLIPDEALKSTLRSSLEGKTLRFFTMGEKSPLILVTLPIKRDYQSFAVMALGIVIDEKFISDLEGIFNNRIVFKISKQIISSNLDAGLLKNFETDSKTERVSKYMIKSIPSPLFYISGGVVYCLYDTSAMYRQIRWYIVISITISLFVLFTSMFVGLIFYRKTFQKPFQILMEGIDKISGGDINPPFAHPGIDEFGDLESSFNFMCSNLIKREKEIAQLSRYNALILNNMKSGIITFDLLRKITTINPAAKRILSVENNVGENVPEEFNDFVFEALDNIKDKTSGEININLGGKRKILFIVLSPLMSEEEKRIGTIVIFEDVTRIRNLEEKLLVSSRLAVLGEMAAGVAHQIKNPLAVMKVSMEMLRDDLAYPEDDTEAGDLSGFILDEIETLDSVVNNFLAFAKPKKGARSYEDVEKIIGFSIRSIPREKYEGIQIRADISGDIRKYLFDRDLIVQAVSNIIINALQCSKRGDAVQVRAYETQNTLVIEIEDHGEGMDEEVLSKMYNPFFTTKKSGTGLGLSIVHRIIEDHNGQIEVNSIPGEGTIFKLVFRGDE